MWFSSPIGALQRMYFGLRWMEVGKGESREGGTEIDSMLRNSGPEDDAGFDFTEAEHREECRVQAERDGGEH